MLSAVITSMRSYPAMLLAEQLVHQWHVHPGPLVLGTALLNFPTPTADRDRTVSRRSEPRTQLAYRFKWRTAIPLGPAPAPGCDEPTSRCQTSPSMWALGGDQPVIPGVPFILWAMTLPHRITGSLWPTFVSARLVCLTVRLAYAITLYLRFPTAMSQPLQASVTF